MKRILPALALTALTLSACEKTPAPEATTTTAQAVTAPPVVEEPKVWTTVDITSITDAQKQQLDRAQEAQKGLGTELVQRLTAVSTEKGFPAAVDVCKSDAPEIAARISSEKGVKIGRTSDKLRNPSNTAPEWFTTLLDTKKVGPAVFKGPNGELGWAAPIKLGDMCVNCHGPADSLAPEVASALTEKYPEDKATGYAAGDLRGWFWVEVPAT